MQRGLGPGCHQGRAKLLLQTQAGSPLPAAAEGLPWGLAPAGSQR